MQPTLKELQAASSLLLSAQTSCESVCDLFFSARQADVPARLSAIAARLGDESEIIGRFIAQLSAGAGNPDRQWRPSDGLPQPPVTEGLPVQGSRLGHGLLGRTLKMPRRRMGARILIVEDNALVALDLGEALEKAEFEVVGPATSVEQALSLIEKQGCDAAVLDINLRGGTSEPVAQALKARATPFVTATGYTRAQQPAVFDGIATFSKPIPAPLLIAELRRCLGQPTGR